MVLPAFRIDRGPVRNGNWPSSSPTAGTEIRRSGVTRAGNGGPREPAAAPLYAERTAAAGRAGGSTVWRCSPAEPVQHVSLVRGGGVRSLGRQATAEPKRSGKEQARVACDGSNRCRGRSGSGPRPASTPTRAFAPSRTGSTLRCSSAGSTGSCAAAPGHRCGRLTDAFRNWDYPQRRQIFSGIRCAGDA